MNSKNNVINTKKRHLKICNEFPMQLACALTIHRSQWLTLYHVTFDPSRIWLHWLLYIALTCIWNIENLYLLHAITKQNFIFKQKSSFEMQWLQIIAKWKLEYDYESIVFGTCILVLYSKTRNLETHLEDVLNKYNLMQYDILCLQET